MDPDTSSFPATSTAGFAPRSTAVSELDYRDMLARAIAGYPSRSIGDWSPTAPSRFAAENSSPLTQLGLAELYPEQFGHLIASHAQDAGGAAGAPDWEYSGLSTSQQAAWAPPSQFEVEHADPLTQLGLAELYPERFGHLIAPHAQVVGGSAEASDWRYSHPSRADPSTPQPTAFAQLPGAGVANSIPLDSSSMNWTLPNGQRVVMDDTVEGPTTAYHHGSFGGAPGLFVDNPSDPRDYKTVFTPSGLDPTHSYGFAVSPEIGPSGERYYDKIVWQAGPRQAILRVDARGQPVKAFTLDTGEAREAAVSPFDFAGPGALKLGFAGLLGVGKVALPFVAKTFGENAAATALSDAEPPAIAIGRSGYQSIEAFRDAVLARYQALYDHHYADIAGLVDDGFFPNSRFHIGAKVDRLVHAGMRDWISEEGIDEGPNGLIRLNRRLYDPGGSGSYRRPDIHIPRADTIFDGTLGVKTAATPQIADFSRFSEGARATIVRPRTLPPGRLPGPFGRASVGGSYGIVE